MARDARTSNRKIASELGVDPAVVLQMEGRLASQDEPFDAFSDDDDAVAPAQYLEDEKENPAVLVENADLRSLHSDTLMKAFRQLDARTREIIQRRWLADRKSTLHELADHFGISAERVRQLEKNALKKLRLGFNL